MIRLKPFDRVSYQELRKNYLEALISSDAVAFDPCDIFRNEGRPGSGKSIETYDKLGKHPMWRPVQNFLFCPDDLTVNTEHLRLLLAGPEPEDMPKSFGGNGKYKTMRDVLAYIIGKIQEIKKPDVAKLKRQKKPEEEIAAEQERLNAWNECTKIFDYDKFSKSNSNNQGAAYWLQHQLDVKVCPFCNRIYTTTLFNRNVRPAFDHFYPKSIYPYLAVSLFNLIPICDICNKAKSDHAEIYRKKQIIYPYDESFDDYMDEGNTVHVSFRVRPNEDEPLNVLRGQSEMFTLQFQPTNDKGEILEGSRCGILTSVDVRERFPMKDPVYWNRVINSIELLKLEALYNTHKNEIMRILRNHYIYNREAIMSILRSLLQSEYSTASEASLTLEAQNMLYFANLDPKDWGITPLNKLKADILKQMDAIEMASNDTVKPLREDEEHGEKRYLSAAGAVAGV